MTKTIRVSDEVYDKLKNDADVHFRTIGGQIEWLYTLSDKPLSVAVHDGVAYEKIVEMLPNRITQPVNESVYTDPEEAA